MQTNLSAQFSQSADGQAAEAIVRKCVHCGLCNATCPTYQLVGDERDGPRGRIYLIKQLLEGATVSRITQHHLDRCLTCLSCETTCPAGVEYGALLDIGRRLVDERVPRAGGDRLRRFVLREGLTSPLFGAAVAAGRRLAPWLPAALRAPLGAAVPAGTPPVVQTVAVTRNVLVLAGCVQPALRPGIGQATRRVLAAAGIGARTVPGAGCCGALRVHLGDTDGGRGEMRRNVDAWWPAIDRGDVEAIVVDASACALAVKSYGEALAGDPAYAARAARISACARDLSEFLPDLVEALKGRLRPAAERRYAFHVPCTLQHGQRLREGVEPHLRALGFAVLPPAADVHLCCGSAGTYSVLQPELARELRTRKLTALQAAQPDVILSANIGCIQHLQAGTERPVRHWIEVLAESLPD